MVETSFCKSYKRKKKSIKRVQASVKKNKKKRSKESGKRSTLESLPSLEFESVILCILLLFQFSRLSAYSLYLIYHKKLAGDNPNLIVASFS